ncbi:MAG: hypothetical protein JST02_04950 [Bacteroidetes bacterium]|nr:hypothetical protein [Bacteroidota bacterium]
MEHAYTYRIDFADNCYWVYLNQTLLGTIEKGVDHSWHINITLTGENFLFTKLGLLKPSIYIQDINSGTSIGSISIPMLPLLPFRSKFQYLGNNKLAWICKSPLSLHWQWRSSQETIIEAVESINLSDRSGLITLETFQRESNLLILAGIFLSLLRKKRLSFGLLHNDLEDWKQGSEVA